MKKKSLTEFHYKIIISHGEDHMLIMIIDIDISKKLQPTTKIQPFSQKPTFFQLASQLYDW